MAQNKGDPADSVIHILDGKVAASSAEIARRVVLQAGDIFGTQALSSDADAVRQVDGVALGEVTVMRLMRSALSGLFEGLAEHSAISPRALNAGLAGLTRSESL